MATYTATRAASTKPYKASPDGGVDAAYGTLEVAALAQDDVVVMAKVPGGARLLSGYLYGDDIDTGTEALDIDMGWAANGGSGTYDTADPDGLGNLGVLTGDTFATGNLSIAVALIYPFQNLIVELPVFTRPTTLQLDVNVAANAGGTGTMSMVAYYVVEPESIAA